METNLKAMFGSWILDVMGVGDIFFISKLKKL
jgi:hypothetical protein